VTHTAEIGGAEVALLRLAAALDPSQFVPHVVVLAEGPLIQRIREEDIGCTVVPGGSVTAVTRSQAASLVRAPGRAKDALRSARALAEALTASGTELAVAHSLKSAVLLKLAAQKARVAWAWHLNDRLAADYLPRPVAAGMRTLAGRGPRVVVANSLATKATLGRRGRKRAVVAYPGLPPTAYGDGTHEVARGDVGLLGRISETKGQVEFVEAAALLRHEHPELRFRIVGSALFADAPYADRVQEAVGKLPDGLVTLVGWVDDPRAQLGDFRLLVHASPVPEPFGQVVLEAMALALPVIATRAGGVVELLNPTGESDAIADGVWGTSRGLLVRPGDAGAMARAIAIAVDNPAITRERALAAYDAAVADFTIAATAEVVQAAWHEALGAR
jgi:glycosyltransferase involved in cell wall biosynthesis